MPPSPQTAKLTSTLHLLIPRLRLLQKKDTASSVVQRRDLAALLENNRDASARIRVENVIATDIAVEVMEMVELYCELLLARANVLDQLAFGEKGVHARNRAREVALSRRGTATAHSSSTSTSTSTSTSNTTIGSGFSFRIFGGNAQKKNASPPPPPPPESSGEEERGEGEGGGGQEEYLDTALDEAAAAVFYAWSRFPHDVRELNILRGLLADRYGKDFMALAQDNKLEGVSVPERLVKGLRVRPPTRELVESYLTEIARAYGVAWGQQEHEEEEEVDAGVPPPLEFGDDDDNTKGPGDDNGDGIGKVDIEARRASETAELNRATPPRGLHAGKSPVSVAPPGPRSDNPSPRVKVPDTDNGPTTRSTEIPSQQRGGATKTTSKGSGIPEVDELSRRFAALKR